MDKLDLLYEGKGKKLYSTNDRDLLIAEFKDDLTAFNAQKRSQESGKGILNNEISTIIFGELSDSNITTHFVKKLNDRDMLVKRVSIIPIEVVVRNVATGSLTKRLGIPEGRELKNPIVEFYYKNDAMNDPIINDEHAVIMGLVDEVVELENLKTQARKINEILKPFFAKVGLRLIDFKLEFGKDKNENIILADEISPDSCRFWDSTTGEKLDKDRFRQDIGGVKVAYEEVKNRILTLQKVYKAIVNIYLKDGVLDSAGKAVNHALGSLGFGNSVNDVRIGRQIILKISANSKSDAEKQTQEMCESLLANTVIEDYNIEIING